MEHPWESWTLKPDIRLSEASKALWCRIKNISKPSRSGRVRSGPGSDVFSAGPIGAAGNCAFCILLRSVSGPMAVGSTHGSRTFSTEKLRLDPGSSNGLVSHLPFGPFSAVFHLPGQIHYMILLSSQASIWSSHKDNSWEARVEPSLAGDAPRRTKRERGEGRSSFSVPYVELPQMLQITGKPGKPLYWYKTGAGLRLVCSGIFLNGWVRDHN